MITKIWKDPVWSKVIATCILSLFGSVLVFCPNILSKIISLPERIFNFLLDASEVSNWLIGLMGFCSILVLIFFVLLLKDKFFSASTSKTWRDYTRDNFLGLEWRWSFDYSGDISGLHSCCPHCKYQVFPKNVSSYVSIEAIAYECDCCGLSVGPFDESYNEFESKIRRFIQQKIRTEGWKSLVENNE